MLVEVIFCAALPVEARSSVKVNGYVKKNYAKNENEITRKND
jgi:hypothetical protein